MRICYSLLFLLLITISSQAQKNKLYSFPGLYKHKSAQGMAIHKNFAFLLNDGGYCRIYDLKKNKLISEFDLASTDKSNHANCASFGVEYPKGNKKFPAIYISECYGKCRCFVESIGLKGSMLIQTLQVKTKGREQYSNNWFVDKRQKYIYTINGSTREIDSIGTKKYLITKFPLPPLDSANVIFTEEDILDQFEVSFPNLLQGGTIRKNYLYLPVGQPDIPVLRTRKDRRRAIIVINLNTKQIEKTIDIEREVSDEPEDIDFYGKNMLLYCGQNGGLFKISEK